jgi:hypothetical protein
MFLSYCSQKVWEQSDFNTTAPNLFGSSRINFGMCHAKVGSCQYMLGEVMYFAMTESALKINFYLPLPNYLGAVIYLSDCSQISWEQSCFCLTAPNKIGSSQNNFGTCHLKIGRSRLIHQINWWLCKKVGRSHEKHETT